MSFYPQLAARRGDDESLQKTVAETIQKLRGNATSVDRPGIVLGKIQSGKTRAFLGVIAAAFDDGFDCALILTKGTKSLAYQTIRRAEADFAPFRDDDQVQIFAYPMLKGRRWLIIDDEADFASLTFRKSDGIVIPGAINQLIEMLRVKLGNSQFLQVTATPYSLYLQPEEGVKINGVPILKPRKPSFTVILPPYSEYVGGDYYFERSLDESSPAAYFYEEVPQDERVAAAAVPPPAAQSNTVATTNISAHLLLALRPLRAPLPSELLNASGGTAIVERERAARPTKHAIKTGVRTNNLDMSVRLGT